MRALRGQRTTSEKLQKVRLRMCDKHSKPNVGGDIDPKKYETLRTAIKGLHEHALAMGHSLEQFAAATIREFGEEIAPYLKKYIMDYQAAFKASRQAPLPKGEVYTSQAGLKKEMPEAKETYNLETGRVDKMPAKPAKGLERTAAKPETKPVMPAEVQRALAGKDGRVIVELAKKYGTQSSGLLSEIKKGLAERFVAKDVKAQPTGEKKAATEEYDLVTGKVVTVTSSETISIPKPIIPNERPYRRYLADEMLALANNSQDPELILALLYEMQFRTTNRAREVQELLSDRLHSVYEQYFEWPTTEAPGGDGQLDGENVFERKYGLLRLLGYRVGIKGLGSLARRQILDRVYLRPLPFVASLTYISKWGQLQSGRRLEKMSNSIAAFARNEKRRDAKRLQVAIVEREEDLAYLKRTYYNGRYDFRWPDTTSF